MKNVLLKTLSLAAFSALMSANVHASSTYTIDFNDPSFIAPSINKNDNKWSQVIDDEYADGRFGGINVNFWTSIQTGVNGFNGLDFSKTADDYQNNKNGSFWNAPYLVLFNTQRSSTADNDLEVGVQNNDGRAANYTGGNIAIIHENKDSNGRCKTTQGTFACKNPDDRYIGGSGAPYGGWVFVQFSQPVNLHSINLIDMENRSNQLGTFGFYNAAQSLVGTQAMMPTTSNTTHSDGDGGWLTQNFNSFGQNVTTLVLRMQGSGGFDNLVFSAARNVSEPSTIAAMLAGFGLLMFRLKRK